MPWLDRKQEKTSGRGGVCNRKRYALTKIWLDWLWAIGLMLAKKCLTKCPATVDQYNTSMLMISQLPTEQWYTSIGDNTLADAILDRLMHAARSV